MTDQPIVEGVRHANRARRSARTVGVVLLLVSLWQLATSSPLAAGIIALGGFILVVIGRSWTRGALAFHNSWMRLAEMLGYINSRILLSVMFYGMITPFGCVRRMMGRNPLRRRGPKQDSYWIPRERPHQSREQFERLF